MSVAVPKLPFVLVSRTEVHKTRPALERAKYRCEGCGREDDLRVADGFGQLVVLCPTCTVGSEFRVVLGRRKAERLAGSRW